MTGTTPAPDIAKRLSALIERQDVGRLMASLSSPGEETRIVGGAVRNALLGLPPGDIDCATTLLPDETMRRARAGGLQAVATGIEHGTVTVIVSGSVFEVTTLREDVETDGRRAVVRFGRDFRADALRRDFTINAMSVDADGRLYDETGGVADLKSRRVRFIGDPDQRIREDYLRILRFFRFHAQYAVGAPDGPALDAAIRQRAGLDRLSRERIRAEMAKLVMAPRAAETLRAMADASLLDRVLGGLYELGRFNRLVARAPALGWPLRLAALAVLVIDDVPRLRDRLRLSNGETEALERSASAFDAVRRNPFSSETEAGVLALAYRFGVPAAQAAVASRQETIPGDIAALLDVLQAERRVVPALPFDGATVMGRGVPPGPGLGAVIRRAETLWLEAGLPSDPKSLTAILDQALDQTPPP